MLKPCGFSLKLLNLKKIAVAERRKRQRQNRKWKRYEKKTLGGFDTMLALTFITIHVYRGYNFSAKIFPNWLLQNEPDKKYKSVIITIKLSAALREFF
jgi:hypothetical protein